MATRVRSMTQDVYLARRAVDSHAAAALEAALGHIVEPTTDENGGKMMAPQGVSDPQSR
ncbi:MAG: hypothetical protein WKF83_06030 [Nocardioidaceae bacterium]